MNRFKIILRNISDWLDRVRKSEREVKDNKMKKVMIIVIVFFISFFGFEVYDRVYTELHREKISFEDDINKGYIDNVDYEAQNKNGGGVSERKSDKKLSHKKADEKIKVYISGAVNSPGVITCESGMRLDDAVKLADGFKDDADISNVNLAEEVKDAKHYKIPYEGEYIENKENNDKSDDSREDGEKIDINTDSVENLKSISGVGEITAKKIIEYRKENGDFKRIEDIKKVTGIGDKKFENMKNEITVK